MKSQLTIALLGCLLSALAQDTDWKISFDTKWRFNCILPGTNITTVLTTGEKCGEICERNDDCDHFTWHNGTCSLRRGCVREGDAQPLRGVGTSCGFLMSRNQECRISKTEIVIIAVVVPISIFTIAIVVIVAKMKKLCCFRPREQHRKTEAVKTVSNPATSKTCDKTNDRPENIHQMQPVEGVYDEIDYGVYEMPIAISRTPEMPHRGPRPPQYMPEFWEISN